MNTRPCRPDGDRITNYDWCAEHDQSVFKCSYQRQEMLTQYVAETQANCAIVVNVLEKDVKPHIRNLSERISSLRVQLAESLQERQKLVEELDANAQVMLQGARDVSDLFELAESLDKENDELLAENQSLMTELNQEGDLLDDAVERLVHANGRYDAAIQIAANAIAENISIKLQAAIDREFSRIFLG